MTEGPRQLKCSRGLFAFHPFNGETSVNPHFGTHFFLISDAYADTVNGLIRLKDLRKMGHGRTAAQ